VTDLLKVLAVFALIIVLIRLKLNMGLVMFVGTAAVGVAYRMGTLEIVRTIAGACVEPATLSVAGALALIMVLENILRTTKMLNRIVDSLGKIIGDRRAIIAVMPALIGLLPSAGGAVFSAPMVEAASSAYRISGERKSFLNYWFRHPWEYVLPLYPGLLLASAITNVPVRTLSFTQIPFSIVVILCGIVYGFWGMDNGARGGGTAKSGSVSSGGSLTCPGLTDKSCWHAFRNLFLGLSPIIAMLVMVLVFKLSVVLSLGLVTCTLLVIYRYNISRLTNLLKSVSISTVLIVFGTMAFKGALQNSKALTGLSEFLIQSHIPVVLLIFVLPFLAGILTGLSIGFVGITFPLIASIYGGGQINPAIVAFAFVSGFTGVLLSPVHLCLVLTCDYFKANFGRIYRLLLFPCGVVLLTAVVKLWMGG
jgi:integral membrane protein (TIGR00529 family)